MSAAHPDDLTGADVFDVPDTSLSPTDPAELVPWLRALPVGTVLLDKNEIAWQVEDVGKHVIIYPATVRGGMFHRNREDNMRNLSRYAPFRVLWSSGGGR